MNDDFVELMKAASGFMQDGMDQASRAMQQAWGPGPAAATPAEGGSFDEGDHAYGTTSRRYKLFVPPRAAAKLPLVVMLHGAGQDPDDFAAGTAMNARAREQGFFVLYPAQSTSANAQRCWNWFEAEHQQRGSGEAAWIADLTRSVVARHRIDPRRVYIAGLSAGGAMATVVAAAHPDLYAAVGVHSGLAAGAAGDLGAAFAAMRSGAASSGAAAGVAVPTIVFHGDEDNTVHPSNGGHVIAAALGRAANAAAMAAPEVEAGVTAGGRRYTRSRYRGGGASAEHWLVHGAGHAWSGGDAAGSYTDAEGPDATGEMLRFFFDHPRPAAAPKRS